MMFKSIEPDDKYGSVFYIVYDDGSTDQVSDNSDIDHFIIHFENRNLNVASNLALMFKFDERTYYHSINGSIKIGLTLNKRYKKYHEDVMKYLMLV